MTGYHGLRLGRVAVLWLLVDGSSPRLSVESHHERLVRFVLELDDVCFIVQGLGQRLAIYLPDFPGWLAPLGLGYRVFKGPQQLIYRRWIVIINVDLFVIWIFSKRCQVPRSLHFDNSFLSITLASLLNQHDVRRLQYVAVNEEVVDRIEFFEHDNTRALWFFLVLLRWLLRVIERRRRAVETATVLLVHSFFLMF